MPAMLKVSTFMLRKSKSLYSLRPYSKVDAAMPLLGKAQKDYLYYAANAPPQCTTHLIHPWFIESANLKGPHRKFVSGTHLHLFDKATAQVSHGFDNFSLKGTLGIIRVVGMHYVFFQVLVEEYTEYMGRGFVKIKGSMVTIHKSLAHISQNHSYEFYPLKEMSPPVHDWKVWGKYHLHKDDLNDWRQSHEAPMMIWQVTA